MNLTNISWTDYTSNPIRATNTETGKAGHFCERVSPGCAHCYASDWNEVRYGTGLSFLPANRDKVEFWLNEKELAEWQKPKYAGRKVFVCDMTDLFGEWVPDEWIERIFLRMGACHHVTFQVLTKRPERMQEWVSGIRGGGWPLPNVWLGVSAENQYWADERIPVLLDTPAAVRFVSVEPMLGPVKLTHIDLHDRRPSMYQINALTGRNTDLGRGCPYVPLDWVICGGESGPKRRPFDLEWARDLRDQCKAVGVAYWMKQAGALRPGAYDHLPDDLKVQESPR